MLLWWMEKERKNNCTLTVIEAVPFSQEESMFWNRISYHWIHLSGVEMLFGAQISQEHTFLVVKENWRKIVKSNRRQYPKIVAHWWALMVKPLLHFLLHLSQWLIPLPPIYGPLTKVLPIFHFTNFTCRCTISFSQKLSTSLNLLPLKI